MNKSIIVCIHILLLVFASSIIFAQLKPNIIIINADDLGYGDLSCYGATKIHTPNIDKLAKSGIRFTNAHSTAATCTPSRYSLITGQYAWRKKGTGVAPGNAALLIEPGTNTLPAIFQRAGYYTGAVGKWHLGLGKEGQLNWNGIITPGPLEIGFNQSFIMPATGDRTPCVYVANHRVVNLDTTDPIIISYTNKIGNEPTGKDNPDLLRMKSSQGHNQTIVNGIGRIGYMSGGKSALWKDDEMAQVLVQEAVSFIVNNQHKPFFLYFAPHDIHVPRVPNKAFVGKSGMGARGDAIFQLDWAVGRVQKVLDSLHLTDNTIIVFTSDNGPVLDDGYEDEAVEKLNGHTPSGSLRGGKYSIFDAGTRVPFLINYPGKIMPTVSNALISQVDLLASFASLNSQKLLVDDAVDSQNILASLLGKSTTGRAHLIEHAGTLAIIEKDWKYIEPSTKMRYDKFTNIELGNDPVAQLYDLKNDIKEQYNLAEKYPEKVKALAQLLERIKTTGRDR